MRKRHKNCVPDSGKISKIVSKQNSENWLKKNILLCNAFVRNKAKIEAYNVFTNK